MDIIDTQGWRKSSRCSGGSCVEVRFAPAGHIEVRDGKLGERSDVLMIEPAEWRLFLAEIAAGQVAPSGNFIRIYEDGPFWVMDDLRAPATSLTFTGPEWKQFVAAAGDGEFDPA